MNMDHKIKKFNLLKHLQQQQLLLQQQQVLQRQLLLWPHAYARMEQHAHMLITLLFVNVHVFIAALYVKHVSTICEEFINKVNIFK